MKVQLRHDAGEDTDPAHSRQFRDLADAAAPVFERALEELGLTGSLPEEVEISVSLLSVPEMAEVNKAHRGMDGATDVLSFPLWEEEEKFVPAGGLPVLPLGDILLCPDYIRANLPPDARAGFLGEMALMLAHGFLHLLAWNHDTDERQTAMEGLQESLRAAILERISAPSSGGDGEVSGQ